MKGSEIPLVFVRRGFLCIQEKTNICFFKTAVYFRMCLNRLPGITGTETAMTQALEAANNLFLSFFLLLAVLAATL